MTRFANNRGGVTTVFSRVFLERGKRPDGIDPVLDRAASVKENARRLRSDSLRTPRKSGLAPLGAIRDPSRARAGSGRFDGYG